MRKLTFIISGIAIFCLLGILYAMEAPGKGEKENSETTSALNKENSETSPNKLVVVWSSADKEVFTKIIYPYTLNSKRSKWWDEVVFLIWGPSDVLLQKDSEVQEKVKEFKDNGIVLEACLWCANQYGVTEDLKKMGIDVKYMGKPLTEYLKDQNCEVITF